MSLRDTWTRDSSGKYVDWTAPPYRAGGRLCLLLPEETSLDRETVMRRTAEYYALTWREMQRRIETI